MINQLYTFSGGSYVVADEWNANFSALQTSNVNCDQAITDANNIVAFPDSDLSQLYAALNAQLNSFQIPGTSVVVSAENEYWKVLGDSQTLTISVPTGMNGESRVVFKTGNDRSVRPITFSYSGTINYIDDTNTWKKAGVKFVFLYETNNNLYVKLLSTGA
ncbi:MAG: hypothetical protein MJ156_00430 [Alphaproteobacteria bacterium]|nr:hypothetical protein [Alphaproteobacteria bacterium]